MYLDFEKLAAQGMEVAVKYGVKILLALIVYFIGSKLLKLLNKMFIQFLHRRDVSDTLKPFLTSLVSLLLNVVLFVIVFSVLGVEMSSFMALLGAAGLAVGLSLSGTLQNFAGGVILLIFKPFKVGDVIEIMGYAGTVSAIHIFHTSIITNDNRRVILPNGGVSSSNLINYSSEEKRRVDWQFTVSYGTDIAKVKLLLQQLASQDDRILKETAVFVALKELGDSAIVLSMRAWVNGQNYWDVFFDMNEKVYTTFAEKNIQIPFRQMEIYLRGKDGTTTEA